MTAIFDFGCSIYYPLRQCCQMISSQLFRDNPFLIISHWDIDHYRLLEAASDDQLKNIRCALVPRQCIFYSSKRMAECLKNLCVSIVAIDTGPRISRAVGLDVWHHGKNYFLQVGQNSPNINYSGLALTLWTKTNCVFFCGDHSHTQFSNWMMSQFKSSLRLLPTKYRLIGHPPISCHMIVPHHGGNACSIKHLITSCFYCIKPGQAVISTGTNYYGHPFYQVEKSLARVGFRIVRTDIKNQDIIINL